MTIIRPAALILALVAALGIVGHMEQTDAENDAQLYFENVCTYKIWPDYRNISPCK